MGESFKRKDKGLEEIDLREAVSGQIKIHGSKSITNRVLLVSSLSENEVILKGSIKSDDTRSMVRGLERLGVRIEWQEGVGWKVKGKGGIHEYGSVEIDVGGAGTVMRFLMMLGSIWEGELILKGDGRMMERPTEGLVEGIKGLGGDIEYLNGKNFGPLKIIGRGIKGGRIQLEGGTSSQYVSSILLSGVYAREDIEVEICGGLVSKPYIDLTKEVMGGFGVGFKNEGYARFKLGSGQRYKRNEDYMIEGDATNASYFWGIGSITEGTVRVYNIDDQSQQGDVGFVRILESMGAGIRGGKGYIEVFGNVKHGVEVDMKDLTDVVPTLGVVALFVEGETRIKNIGHMRYKETDRISALAKELRKIGAEVLEEECGLWIQPRADRYRGVRIKTYGDHRMGMAFAIAGLKIEGMKIEDAGCVAKTFPGYFDEFKKLIK